MDFQIPDPSDFDLERKKIARRRAIAEELIRTQAPALTGQTWAPSGSGLGGVGAALSRAAGSIQNDRLDREAAELARRERETSDALLSSIPGSGPERQQAQLRAMSQMPSLREAIKAQMGLDEKEAERIEKGEQAAADRVLREQEAERARIERGEQLAADRVSKAELKQMPTIHITNSGGPGGGKPPSGYRWTEDGNLAPIAGGPADKSGKPLTQKQLDTQRGFMDLQSSLDTYEQLLDRYNPQGEEALDPATRAAVESAFTDVQMKLKTLYELGAPQAGDLQLLEQSFNNPTSIGGSLRGAAFGKEPFKAKVGQARQLLKTSQANFEKQLGKETPEAAKPDALPEKPKPKVIKREVRLKDGRIGLEFTDGTRGFYGPRGTFTDGRGNTFK